VVPSPGVRADRLVASELHGGSSGVARAGPADPPERSVTCPVVARLRASAQLAADADEPAVPRRSHMGQPRQEDSTETSCPSRNEHPMHATIRRYESIDQSRTSGVVTKVDESRLPALRGLARLPRLFADRLRQRRPDLRRPLQDRRAGRRVDPHRQQLAARAEAPASPPKITSGTVAVHKTREPAQAYSLRTGQRHREGPDTRASSTLTPPRPAPSLRQDNPARLRSGEKEQR
jgi:hypothetical protein